MKDDEIDYGTANMTAKAKFTTLQPTQEYSEIGKHSLFMICEIDRFYRNADERVLCY